VGGQRPFLISGEKGEFVLGELVVILFTAMDEFWAVSVPAGMHIRFAGGAEVLFRIATVFGVVTFAACSAGIVRAEALGY
jgi:hypothetical protein